MPDVLVVWALLCLFYLLEEIDGEKGVFGGAKVYFAIVDFMGYG